jgi:MFS transporter, SP family, solute carrier family 2 (myo-inositol transporter), member 13
MSTPEAIHHARQRFLLIATAGLGGLLYGIDVGIIAGALPYLEATSGLNAGQISFIVAAVMLGSVISTLFAGALADFFGRRWMMVVAGVTFVVSIPIISLAQGYVPLLLGRVLQGVSAGLIGVVIPLYLAECLGASSRGKGTAVFQWMLTFGIMLAALIGIFFSEALDNVAKSGSSDQIFAFKDSAWRNIFWVSLPPGLLFVVGALMMAESPRWLLRQGRTDAALDVLLRSRTPTEAETDLAAMKASISSESTATRLKESLFQRRYVIPFLLTCVILACNQLTGVNSIIGYCATILTQSGLDDLQSHRGYLVLTVVNFLCTMVGMLLVDRKGRKFLLSLGSAGIVVSLALVSFLFQRTEAQRVDVKDLAQVMVTADQSATIRYDQVQADALLKDKPRITGPSTLIIIYSYGDFRAATKVVRSNDVDQKAQTITLTRESCVPSTEVQAFFSNPFANLTTARTAPLVIEHALITPIPSTSNGWLTAIGMFMFMAFFAIGPGVCVWLALSELMPTRIRSNGMSIALLLNQAVSTTIAGIFLPTVGTFGYATMFIVFAGCTVVYFLTVTFILPETKGRTLEDIERGFAKRD